jgi:exopolyphosphatase/pppGpp-phosphohydrolase
VAVRDTLLSQHPPSPHQWIKAFHSIRNALKKIPVPTRKSHATFSGGTGHAYACLIRRKNMKARKLEGFSLSLSTLESLILRLLPLSLPQLRALPGMPTDRASLALPAFLVLRETMLRLRLSRVQLTTHGLRYGVWLDSLAPCPIRKIVR